MPFRYPISLDVEGRRCVVIGGGPEAEDKARALVDAGAIVMVVAERFTAGLEELADRSEVVLTGKPYSPGDLQGAFVAVAATKEPDVNAEVFREAEERRVLLNAVDDVDHCHFAVPSVVRRGDFTVTISTGGLAPALSKRLRIELSEQFGAEFGILVELLGQVREEALVDREVDFDTWARRWQEALSFDLLELVREGRFEDVKGLVRRSLEGSPDGSPLS
jgi:siroheme synthase-like protein